MYDNRPQYPPEWDEPTFADADPTCQSCGKEMVYFEKGEMVHEYAVEEYEAEEEILICPFCYDKWGQAQGFTESDFFSSIIEQDIEPPDRDNPDYLDDEVNWKEPF